MPNSPKTDEQPYNIHNWGDGYFRYNQAGNIEVVNHATMQAVALIDIVDQARKIGLKLPLLLQFSDILTHRVKKINQAFQQAIAENHYQGTYQLVYPIKVNQKVSVVTSLLKDETYLIGLEAGSKSELMAVIGLLNHRRATIICNGYKDSSYIRLALIASALGHDVCIVIEKYTELAIILEQSDKLKIKPNLGVRVRLVTKSVGKWENSSGTNSKFGLNTEQMLRLIKKLKSVDRLDCLRVLHCHLGSQNADIHGVRQCMQEVAHYYAQLRSLNVPIATIDVGGGLAVDYEGTYSTNDYSMNYSVKEYATNILLALQPICKAAQIPEPNIISESGRALTAHHAVLISNINDVEEVDEQEEPSISKHSKHHFVIQDIKDTFETLDKNNPIEAYNFAIASLEEAHSMFKHGLLSLQDKALVEHVFLSICLKIKGLLDPSIPSEEVILHLLQERLSCKVYCNLSFFQSIPDAWAIGQIFPVVPISHLHTSPCVESILYDLTCDSDGTIKQYTGGRYLSDVLMLPKYHADDPYLLGFFLVGAYQEILGNLHNLFGTTNSLNVTLLEKGTFEINEVTMGDKVEDVLRYANYDTYQLLASYEKQLMQANLSEAQSDTYLQEIRRQFQQLTYLESVV